MSTAHNSRASKCDFATVRQANERAPAYLLNLPGEIRNHIYGFVLDHQATVNLSKKINTLRYDLGLVEPPAKRWPSMKRSAYGLTQICREIRTEFLPLYRRNTTVKLQWQTLLQYSSTVFPDPAAATGCFVVGVTIDYVDKDCIDHMTILLWLRQKAPNLNIRIEAPIYGGLSLNPRPGVGNQMALTKFFRQVYVSSPSNFKQIASLVRKIVFNDANDNWKGLERALEIFKDMTIVSGRHFRIHCEVHAQFKESWMPYIHRRDHFVLSSGSVSPIKKEAVELMGSIGLDARLISSLKITAEDPEASEDVQSPQDRLPFRRARLRPSAVRLS